MPKCEIFDRSDFHDLYHKVFMGGGGDFGVKINFFLIFRGSFRTAKFLTHILSLILEGFLSLGKKKFLGAFETICGCQ